VVSKAIRLYFDYAMPFFAYHCRHQSVAPRASPEVVKFQPYPSVTISSLDTLIDTHDSCVTTATIRFYEALHAIERDIRSYTEEARDNARPVNLDEMRTLAFRFGQAIEQAANCIEALRSRLDDEWDNIEKALAKLHLYDFCGVTLLDALRDASRVAKLVDAGEEIDFALEYSRLKAHRKRLDEVLPLGGVRR